MKKLLVQAILTLLGLSAWTAASAQGTAPAYPNRQIRLIVTGTPGQGTDVLSRLIAQKLSERFGQQVIVDNRPGAGATVASFVAYGAEGQYGKRGKELGSGIAEGIVAPQTAATSSVEAGLTTQPATPKRSLS